MCGVLIIYSKKKKNSKEVEWKIINSENFLKEYF